MKRETILVHEQALLDTASELFRIRKGNLRVFSSYEGCANLVYEFEHEGQSRILRVSFRRDRTAEQIRAELHFVNYLAENGVRVSRPVSSRNAELLETIWIEGNPLHLVCFVKGRGMRVPDNGYRYREDAPIEEYFQNWGRVLGQMQALTKRYQPLSDQVKRPEWFEIHDRDLEIATRVPDRLPIVRDRIQSLLGEIRALPRDKDAYGLIHGDFNDGNFTVDYTNGDITVFDFDDSCYLNFVQNNPGSIRPMQNEGDSIPAMQNNRGSNPKNVANRQVDPRRRVRTLTI